MGKHKKEVIGVSSSSAKPTSTQATEELTIENMTHPLPHISTWTDEFEKAFVCRNARYEGDIFTSDEEDHEYHKCWTTRLRTKETKQRPCRYIVKHFINNDMPNGVVYNFTFSETLVTDWAGQPSATLVLSYMLGSRVELTEVSQVSKAFKSAMLESSVDKLPQGTRTGIVQLYSHSFMIVHAAKNRLMDLILAEEAREN